MPANELLWHEYPAIEDDSWHLQCFRNSANYIVNFSMSSYAVVKFAQHATKNRSACHPRHACRRILTVAWEREVLADY